MSSITQDKRAELGLAPKLNVTQAERLCLSRGQRALGREVHARQTEPSPRLVAQMHSPSADPVERFSIAKLAFFTAVTPNPLNKVITNHDNENCIIKEVVGNRMYKSDCFHEMLLYLAIILWNEQHSHPLLTKEAWEDNTTLKEKTRGSGSPAALKFKSRATDVMPLPCWFPGARPVDQGPLVPWDTY